jgi:hypothetical protein
MAAFRTMARFVLIALVIAVAGTSLARGDPTRRARRMKGPGSHG